MTKGRIAKYVANTALLAVLDLHQPKVHLRQKVYFRQNRVQMRMGQ